ncbi:uncharacterized protein AB675_3217 [Cyphellophora attinorum]|uniref:Uncharacterized protein n=1 Tax=Cyphellophora attinorum TaxID=1664694 RepID=A0A0N1H1B3_9EURO|nr:uncharacterized protein AB675_3217 [Phialophora attinorum]KPI37842.1 hypothetical protein AB675_3217 [Phialophora attinorum]
MAFSAKVLALLVPCYLQWCAAAAPQLTSIPTRLPSIPTRSADNALALEAQAMVTGLPDYWAPTETNSDGLPVLTINRTAVSTATLTGQAVAEAIPTAAMAGGRDFDDFFKPEPEPVYVVPGSGPNDSPSIVVGNPVKRNADKPTCTELVEECRRSGRWDCGWEWLDPANCDPIVSYQETGVALLNANAIPARNDTIKVDCNDYCADWLVKCVKKEDQSLNNYGCVCTYML